jgi:hypothetical protein
MNWDEIRHCDEKIINCCWISGNFAMAYWKLAMAKVDKFLGSRWMLAMAHKKSAMARCFSFCENHYFVNKNHCFTIPNSGNLFSVIERWNENKGLFLKHIEPIYFTNFTKGYFFKRCVWWFTKLKRNWCLFQFHLSQWNFKYQKTSKNP